MDTLIPSEVFEQGGFGSDGKIVAGPSPPRKSVPLLARGAYRGGATLRSPKSSTAAMLGKRVAEKLRLEANAVKRKTQFALSDEAAEPAAMLAEDAREELPPGEGQLRLDMAAAAAPPASPDPPRPEEPAGPPRPAGLEERVRRLEDILADLQHTRTDIQETPSLPLPELPAPERPPLSPDDVQLPPPAGTPWLSPGLFPSPRWLPIEMLAEFRAMIRMYLDPRYRLTWQTRLLPALILVAMFLSWLTFAHLTLIGFLLDRIVFLVLAYALFKVLTREATRYRMTSPDIPSSMRL